MKVRMCMTVATGGAGEARTAATIPKLSSVWAAAVGRQRAAGEPRGGSRVFDGLPRGGPLTERGRPLLPPARAALAGPPAARRDLDQLRGLGGGRLRVGAFATAVAALVPRALA